MHATLNLLHLELHRTGFWIDFHCNAYTLTHLVCSRPKVDLLGRTANKKISDIGWIQQKAASSAVLWRQTQHIGHSDTYWIFLYLSVSLHHFICSLWTQDTRLQNWMWLNISLFSIGLAGYWNKLFYLQYLDVRCNISVILVPVCCLCTVVWLSSWVKITIHVN